MGFHFRIFLMILTGFASGCLPDENKVTFFEIASESTIFHWIGAIFMVFLMFCAFFFNFSRCIAQLQCYCPNLFTINMAHICHQTRPTREGHCSVPIVFTINMFSTIVIISTDVMSRRDYYKQPRKVDKHVSIMPRGYGLVMFTINICVPVGESYSVFPLCSLIIFSFFSSADLQKS